MAVKTDHALERLVFFSDAVFAIAITLLVIEIHAPHLPPGASDLTHLQALADLVPSFVGYFISFAVIGLFWMGHHRAFTLAAHYHPRILGWNIALLAIIAFMPFATAYSSANWFERVPTITYCATMLLAALLNFQTNRTATSPPMVGATVDPQDVRYVRQRGLSVILGSASAVVAAAFVSPKLGQMALASIPLWRLLLTSWDRRRRAPRPA
jgi:TMEM175 potassium channel family protein